MNRVYDCFLFFNEFDLLELRLKEGDPIVDKWILVEADRTHRGDLKPLHFKENMDRYSQWLDRIEYISVTHDMPNTGSPLDRDYWQKEFIKQGLPRVDDDDVVVVSDLDEIPRSDAIKNYDGRGMGIMSLQMRNFRYYINYRCYTDWYFAKILPGVAYNRLSISQIRYLYGDRPTPGIPDAGWHFSWMGTTESRLYKIEQYAHCDAYNKPMTEAWREGVAPEEYEARSLRKVDIDESYPLWVQKNIDACISKGLIKT